MLWFLFGPVKTGYPGPLPLKVVRIGDDEQASLRARAVRGACDGRTMGAALQVEHGMRVRVLPCRRPAEGPMPKKHVVVVGTQWGTREGKSDRPARPGRRLRRLVNALTLCRPHRVIVRPSPSSLTGGRADPPRVVRSSTVIVSLDTLLTCSSADQQKSKARQRIIILPISPYVLDFNCLLLYH